MHYYQFNIDGYRAATAHLTNDEDLAYRRLLDMYYDTEEKIPLETEWVARRLRLACEVVNAVLIDMFVKNEDGWFHPVCDENIKHYKAMAEKNRANGRLGGRRKKPSGLPVETDSEPNAKATNNYKPITKNHKLNIETFDQFWNTYPKKQAKQSALKAFQKLNPTDDLLQTMIQAIEVQKSSEQWSKDNGKFIPYPATWLNDQRWLDELSAPAQQKRIAVDL